MNYRQPKLPWIIAACFLGAAILFGALAGQRIGPWNGLAWGIVAAIEAVMAGAIVAMKIAHDRRAR